LHNVKLKNRTLWQDGDSTVKPQEIIDRITSGDDISTLFVESLTDDIIQYNKLVTPEEAITVKDKVKELSFEWNIPEQYKTLDVVLYVKDKLFERDGDKHDIDLREQRCAMELKLYQRLEHFTTLQVLIYIVDTLIKDNAVWGVGRGSSVSSYVLYLIGIHDVDSFHYDLDIEDFLRT